MSSCCAIYYVRQTPSSKTAVDTLYKLNINNNLKVSRRYTVSELAS